MVQTSLILKGKQQMVQDMIKITVKPEYYTDSEQVEEKEYDADPEYMVTEQDYEEEFPPISDEDINDLIK